MIKQIHKGEVAFLQGPCTPSPWAPRTVLFLLGHSRHLDGHMTPWVLGEVISLFSVSGTHLPSQLPGLCWRVLSGASRTAVCAPLGVEGRALGQQSAHLHSPGLSWGHCVPSGGTSVIVETGNFLLFNEIKIMGAVFQREKKTQRIYPKHFFLGF